MKPVVLVIRDGWGRRRKKEGNAPLIASTPVTDRLLKRYPVANLEASGEAVGLPKGYQGNSEVGHLTIGSGRIIYQSLMRINNSISDGSFFSNKAFLKTIKSVKKKKGRLHLMGLLQDQGVHAHENHLYALLKLARQEGIKDILIHVFTDGRDTPAKSAAGYISKLSKKLMLREKIVSIIGRYYALDRDHRWLRTEYAYQGISKAFGEKFDSWENALEDAYSKNESDEFIKPRIIGDYDGINDGDGLIFYNFRYDRARQLSHAFLDKNFNYFHRDSLDISFSVMTEYYHDISCPVAFFPIKINSLLGEVISKKKLKQLRISETEKYAHVTFFFNGLEEKAFRGEDRILIPSPHVATYDLKPEMSVFEIGEKVVNELKKKKYSFFVINLVNGDMVGHTGNLIAAVKACEYVDKVLGDISNEVLRQGGTLLVTADHGNCEEMVGDKRTSHTLNPVDLIFVSGKILKIKRKKGGLMDIAPTVLKLLRISKPKEMDGESFI